MAGGVVQTYKDTFHTASVFFLLFPVALIVMAIIANSSSTRGATNNVLLLIFGGLALGAMFYTYYVASRVFSFLGDLTVHLDYYHNAIHNIEKHVLDIEKQAKDRSESVEKRLESIEKRAEYTRQIIREMRDHQAGEKV